MKRRDIENNIRKIFADTTPDIRDRILAECGEQPERTEAMKTIKFRPNFTKRFAAVAAAFVILAAAAFTAVIYTNNYTVASTVSLDVNPGIEMELSRKDRVVSIDAANEDGRKILGDMELKGSDVEVTVNAIIGSMLKNGYLNTDANSVLVSVEAKDSEKGAALQQKLNELIKSAISSDEFDGAVISQTIEHNETLKAEAERFNITEGKARLIERLVESNPLYSFEKLAALSINELNLLAGSLDGVVAEGSPSENKYIGRDAAKAKALEYAKLTEADITGYECEFDNDDGIMVYEIEFRSGGREYDIDVNALTGEIVEVDNDYFDAGRNDTEYDASRTDYDDRDDNIDNDRSSNVGATDSNITVTPAQAKAKALADAGVTESQIRDYSCELDRDDGVVKYEIDFESGNTEYSYEINAETGKIIEREKEAED